MLTVDGLLAGRFDVVADALHHLILPAVVIALGPAVAIGRVLRSSLLDQRNESYVGVARLRGVSESRILWRHMLKNAALPALTMIGVQFGFLFGGALLGSCPVRLLLAHIVGRSLQSFRAQFCCPRRPDKGGSSSARRVRFLTVEL